MTTRHRSLLSIPAALAVLAAGACGGNTEGGIPPARADALVEDLDQVARAVSSTRCEDATAQVQSFTDRIVELPQSVDPELRARLQEGAERLGERATTDCAKAEREEEPAEEPVPEAPPPTFEDPEPAPAPTPAPEEQPEEDEPVEPPEDPEPPEDGDGGNGGGNGNGNGNGGGNGGGNGSGGTSPLPGGGAVP